MKNASSFILGLVVILLVAGAGYAYFGKKAEAPIALNETEMVTPTPTPAPSPENDDSDINVSIDTSVEVTPTAKTVTYSDSGFSPSNITVKSGEKVIFVNNSSGKMWVASDIHPSHTAYNGTARQDHCPDLTQVAFDQCADGQTYTFTFTKAGKWNYHNHLSADKVGSVTVE